MKIIRIVNKIESRNIEFSITVEFSKVWFLYKPCTGMLYGVSKTVPKASITPDRSKFAIGGCFLFIQ